MTKLITRSVIERAVRLEAEQRSDYDLNPDTTFAPTDRLRAAAVLCGVIEREGALRVILTQRPDTMKEHAGQIAFPGGKIEDFDDGPVAAALREAREEIGLEAGEVDVIGRIDAYVTGTGFQVEPIVGWVSPGFVARPDPREVDDAFEAPLDFLMDAANLQRHAGSWGGRRRLYYAIPWEGRFIWGATAGMLKSLADRIAALET